MQKMKVAMSHVLRKKLGSGYHAGFSLTKEAKDINFDLDLMYGNEDGLINQIAAVSLTKSFGKNYQKFQ